MSEGDLENLCLKYPQYQAHLMRDKFPKMKALDQSEFYANKCVDAGNNVIQYVILSEDTKHFSSNWTTQLSGAI